jgi:hypothetical protein
LGKRIVSKHEDGQSLKNEGFLKRKRNGHIKETDGKMIEASGSRDRGRRKGDKIQERIKNLNDERDTKA